MLPDYHIPVSYTHLVVDRKDMITGSELKDGDVLIGMASTGVHSNGFSLVRKVFQMDEETLNRYHEELGKTLGETLLAPTRIYVNALDVYKRQRQVLEIPLNEKENKELRHSANGLKEILQKIWL